MLRKQSLKCLSNNQIFLSLREKQSLSSSKKIFFSWQQNKYFHSNTHLKKMICAVDQGTTSTRVVIYKFDQETKELKVKSLAQAPHTNYFPNPGWVEHDPEEILNVTKSLISEAYQKYKETKSENDPTEISAIGITNQRETTVVWDKQTGKPLYNAIGTCFFKAKLIINCPSLE